MSSTDSSWMLSSTHRTASTTARVVIGTLGSIGAAAALLRLDPPVAIVVPVGMLAVAALLAHRRGVGLQLVARSVWWTNLVLGVLIAVAGNHREMPNGALLAVAAGAALLAMGDLGLEDDGRGPFRPVAFRATLSLGMILAVGDVQGLTFFGAIGLEEGRATPNVWLLFACAALLLVAIVGLYRLRVWGLALASLGALTVGAPASTDVFGLPEPLERMLAATSTLAVLLPIPVFVAIARRRAPAPVNPKVARLFASAVVVALVGAAVLAVVER